MIQKSLNPMMLSPITLLVYPGMFMTACADIWYPFLKRPRQNLPLQNEITLFLVRCRLNLPLKYLSYQVNLSTIYATLHKILDLIYYKLNFLLSSVRIHVERIIGGIKNRFRILDGLLPITFIKSLIDECGEDLVPTVDKLVTASVSLVNLSTGIIYSEKPCV